MNKDKKQIIFIMTDTTRWDMLGCYGNKDMITPNLDRLASEGIRFDNAYTVQPVCGPARSAIFTGMYPHSNGSWANALPLYANIRTVGQRMRDNGIEAAYIGKWHLDGSDYFGNGICPKGWNADYWYDMRTYIYEMKIDERFRSRLAKTMYENGGISEEYTYGHRCSDKAINFIKKFNDESYFLTVSYDEPHGPSLCPEPYASMYKDYEFPKAPNVWDTLEGKPEYQKFWAGDRVNHNRDDVKLKFPATLGCNSYADYEIGRVLDIAHEYAPNALIVFTSDHGDMFESHCLYSKACAAYDEITKIPLIIKSSENVRNTVFSSPISHIDLTPTFLDYMRIVVPSPLQGSSILPIIKNPESEHPEHPVFIEFGRYENIHDCMGGMQMMRCVFNGRYKLALHLTDIDELYDHETDPYEMKNLIFDESCKEIRNSLHDQILEMMNRTCDPFRGYQWGRRSWRPDYKPTTGNFWDMDGLSRQINIEGYEPDQLEYWTALEVMEPHQVPNRYNMERIIKMIADQKIREENRNK
ncbi:MAG: sulfatase [Clostridiales bacterium GWF2_38_85]|nr:MAG: sulfatase [Clostridiales bacterium GWF2_38_85]HBL83623.1 sulfatase [Clostridiales bacterium]